MYEYKLRAVHPIHKFISRAFKVSVHLLYVALAISLVSSRIERIFHLFAVACLVFKVWVVNHLCSFVVGKVLRHVLPHERSTVGASPTRIEQEQLIVNVSELFIRRVLLRNTFKGRSS